jgi:Family of unknown function (DUF6166)
VAKAYVGVRQDDGTAKVFFADGKMLVEIDPRRDLWDHSPTGVEWGYAGSGPAQLALAMLARVTGCPHLALLLHQQFKCEVVMHFRRAGFHVPLEDIIGWIFQATERRLCPPVEYSVKAVAHES